MKAGEKFQQITQLHKPTGKNLLEETGQSDPVGYGPKKSRTSLEDPGNSGNLQQFYCKYHEKNNRKLCRIILLHFELVTFRCSHVMGELENPSRIDGRVRDSQSQYYLV